MTTWMLCKIHLLSRPSSFGIRSRLLGTVYHSVVEVVGKWILARLIFTMDNTCHTSIALWGPWEAPSAPERKKIGGNRDEILLLESEGVFICLNVVISKKKQKKKNVKKHPTPWSNNCYTIKYCQILYY